MQSRLFEKFLPMSKTSKYTGDDRTEVNEVGIKSMCLYQPLRDFGHTECIQDPHLLSKQQ
jgi:hypothetical protein